jgi:quercetin dioxygenase-like cupin family protein
MSDSDSHGDAGAGGRPPATAEDTENTEPPTDSAGADGDDPPRAIHNPVTGVTIREFADDREGAEVVLAPGSTGPAAHVHPEIEERFEVLAGQPTFRVDGRERALDPGADIWVSPGTSHSFRNDGDAVARIRVRTVPDSETLGRVVATLFGLAAEGKTDADGRPAPLQAAVMAEATLDETYFADVPYPVQRAFGDLLGPVGRALGYEATYEKYTEASFWRAMADEHALDSHHGRDHATGNPSRADPADE